MLAKVDDPQAKQDSHIMGHCLQAFIGQKVTISSCLANVSVAKVVPRPHCWALVPLSEALIDYIHGQHPEGAAQVIPPFEYLTEAIAAWAVGVFAKHPVAYIETEYAGGDGSQVAIAWKDGRVALGPLEHDNECEENRPRVSPRAPAWEPPDLSQDPINTALRFLGVKADEGQDEFDTLRLVEFRLTDWAVKAERPQDEPININVQPRTVTESAGVRHARRPVRYFMAKVLFKIRFPSGSLSVCNMRPARQHSLISVYATISPRANATDIKSYVYQKWARMVRFVRRIAFLFHSGDRIQFEIGTMDHIRIFARGSVAACRLCDVDPVNPFSMGTTFQELVDWELLDPGGPCVDAILAWSDASNEEALDRAQNITGRTDSTNQSPMTRLQLVDKLVRTYHLNVPEREQLDPPTLSIAEVAEAIEKAFTTNPFFPSIARPVNWHDKIAEPIFEGYFLENRMGVYIVHGQSVGPHPCAFRGRSEKSFDSLEEAVAYYIEKEYQGNIDGIRII